jgi:hypothetical protein|tara:strand:+ start:2378 stop:2689 length:312 start_codon:yes stop_codon:yes gene_type:complete
VKTRKLIDGREAQELEQPIKLLIETKCPSKWKIVDMETGQAYIGTNNNKKFQYWQPIDDNRLKNIETELKELNKKLSKHIDFIDDTYEGLKNPINAARRWLGR